MDLPLDAAMALVGLPFGAPKSEVRAFFPGQPQPFKRTQIGNEGDYWSSLGAFAHYDGEERLKALELAAEARPTLSGRAITALPLQQAKQLLRGLDRDLEVEVNGAISKRLGISVWSGAGTHGLVQAVLRFAPGYYD